MIAFRCLRFNRYYTSSGGLRGRGGFQARHLSQATLFLPGSPEDAAFREEWNMDLIEVVDLREEDAAAAAPPFPLN